MVLIQSLRAVRHFHFPRQNVKLVQPRWPIGFSSSSSPSFSSFFLSRHCHPQCRPLTTATSDSGLSPQATPPGASSREQNQLVGFWDLPADKPLYVTTPIFYVNSDPHIGHLHSLILADVFKRWSDLGRPRPCPAAILGTGTDEHGFKVQRAADAASVTPQELCDANSAKFVGLARVANVANDNFVRTSSEHHKRAVREVWDRLIAKGLIYKAKKSGWYSVTDETFYSEAELITETDPTTGRVVKIAGDSGNVVEYVEETNYLFRLTGFRDRLLEQFDQKQFSITPWIRRSEMRSWVDLNLEDFSVSRPASRQGWGIPVPGDDDQVIYVWFDALVNYLSQIGFPDWEGPDAARAAGWPANLQVIGKDIQRFHCIYWPAMLMALDLPLPHHIFSHPHWTVAGKKMSKSAGNVIDPFQIIERFGVDQIRYYMMRHSQSVNDMRFVDRHFQSTNKIDLISLLGNLFARIRGNVKSPWDLAAMVRTMSDGRYKDGRLTGELDEQLRSLREQLSLSVDDAIKCMERLQVGPAMQHLANPRVTLNQLLDATRFWKIDVTDSTEPRDAILYHTADVLRVTSILLQPFMPGKMAQMLDNLGVDPARRTFEWAVFGRDQEYGAPLPGASPDSPLFKRDWL